MFFHWFPIPPASLLLFKDFLSLNWVHFGRLNIVTRQCHVFFRNMTALNVSQNVYAQISKLDLHWHTQLLCFLFWCFCLFHNMSFIVSYFWHWPLLGFRLLSVRHRNGLLVNIRRFSILCYFKLIQNLFYSSFLLLLLVLVLSLKLY